MKLKDFYIENKNRVRLNFDNGISRIVPTNQLDLYLSPAEIGQIKKAINLKYAYLRKFPNWLKAWGLVSAGALVLLSSSSRAQWRFLSSPLTPISVQAQPQSAKPISYLPPKTPNQPTKTTNSNGTELGSVTEVKSGIKSHGVKKVNKAPFKYPQIKSKQGSSRPNHKL